jgi:hypothetical protein
MSWKLRVVLLSFALISTFALDSRALEEFTPPPGSSSGGGGCNYCSLDQCGCPSHEGCTTNFTCSCSPIWCSRQCSYKCSQ